MDAFNYWRQLTCANTTNDESERDYPRIIIQELEKQREEMLQDERKRRLDNMKKSFENSCEAEERLQQEKEIRMDKRMKSLEKP